MSVCLCSPENLPKDSIDTISLNAGGHFGSFKFTNTCVADSLLMAFYFCSIQHDHIASLFDYFEKLRAPMVFLRAGMYNEAKASWLLGGHSCHTFKVTKGNAENKMWEIDAWSEPKDHLHMFSDLVLPNCDSTPISQEVIKKTLG